MSNIEKLVNRLVQLQQKAGDPNEHIRVAVAKRARDLRKKHGVVNADMIVESFRHDRNWAWIKKLTGMTDDDLHTIAEATLNREGISK